VKIGREAGTAFGVIEAGRSFAVETTLRTGTAVTQARLAHSRGFATEMAFVATDSLDENLDRILQRAQGGGHGASEREVRPIHEASLANLNEALAVFERVGPRPQAASTSLACRRSARLAQYGGPRGDARAGGSVGSPMARRYRVVLAGSAIIAMRRRRPPQ